MHMKTGRIETLCDGVFAIAMTLVVVSMGEIIGWPKNMDDKQLLNMIVNLGPDIISYFQSFIILGAFWLAHHKQFHYIQRTDSVLIFLNIAALMFVSLIPFATILIGNHPGARVSAILFETNILIAGSLFFAHWAYATRKNHLVDASLSPAIVRMYTKRSLTIPIASVAAIALSFFNPYLSTLTYFAIPVVILFQKS